ncbi:Ig-like domain-containing protein [Nakamurella alba]|nr:Ig-like domain-containing protein [Nakamurella alba]
MRKSVITGVLMALAVGGLGGMGAGVAVADVPDKPRGDLTGDGTVDRWEFEQVDSIFSTLTITPADSDGAFAGRTFVETVQTGSLNFEILMVLGQVRDDGSWQMFISYYPGFILQTMRRTVDDFVLEEDNGTGFPIYLAVDDTDGDGRDDRVIMESDQGNQAYATDIDGSGRMVRTYEVATYKTSTWIEPVEQSSTYGSPVEITFGTLEDEYGFYVSGVAQVLIDGKLYKNEPYDWLAEGYSGGTVRLPFLAPGEYDIEVRFPGSERALPSSASTTITVEKAPTTTALTITPSSPLAKQKTTVTITVKPNPTAGGAATGYVVVLVDWKNPKVIRLSGGKATTTLTFATKGKHTVQGGYSGDGFREPSGTVRTITVR